MVVYDNSNRILIEFLISNYYARIKGSQVVLMVKNPPASAGDVRDTDVIPGLGRFLGKGHGNPLQYSCLSDFPDGSGGKESTDNMGVLGLIPGLGRSHWASLVAQTVKNLPVMRETWVRSLDWEDLLEEGMATHSRILAWRIPMDRGAWLATVHGVTKSWI